MAEHARQSRRRTKSALPATHTEVRSDAQLLVAVRDGDVDTLRELYERHSDAVLRLVRRLAPAAMADDLLQETWLAVWQSAGSYRGDSSVRGWILGIARRQTYYLLRRRKVDTVQLDADVDVADPAMPVDDQALSAIGHSALMDAISLLSDKHRVVLELGLVEGLPYGEIAMVLDIPQGTIKSRMSTARSKLVTLLSERGLSR